MSASLANKEKQRKSGLWEGHLVPSYREKCLTVLCHGLQEGVEGEQRRGIRVILEGACSATGKSFHLVWRNMRELWKAFDHGRNMMKHDSVLKN